MASDIYDGACEVRDAVIRVEDRLLELRVELERTNAVLERLSVSVGGVARWIALGQRPPVEQGEVD